MLRTTYCRFFGGEESPSAFWLWVSSPPSASSSLLSSPLPLLRRLSLDRTWNQHMCSVWNMQTRTRQLFHGRNKMNIKTLIEAGRQTENLTQAHTKCIHADITLTILYHTTHTKAQDRKIHAASAYFNQCFPQGSIERVPGTLYWNFEGSFSNFKGPNPILLYWNYCGRLGSSYYPDNVYHVERHSCLRPRDA